MSLAFYPSRFAFRAWPVSTRRWPMLLTLGGSSLLVYWLGLLLPYNVFALGPKPLLDSAKLTRDQPLAQAAFVLTFAALFGLYYLLWRVCRPAESPPDQRQTKAMWLSLMAGLLAVNLSLLWLYPIDAADIFDNIFHGRITAIYHANPFYEAPSHYSQDVFYPYVAWPYATSAYGPVWEMLAAGTSRLVGDDKLANVLGFKLLGVMFYFGCIALIAAILNRRAPERALQGVCLFAWNPLVIYETAGNGHNDVVLAFFILLGMSAWLNRRFTWAALALTAGALVKFIPVLLLPAVVAAGLRAAPDRRSRLLFLILTGGLCAALIIATYAPFWRGGDPLDIGRRSELFTTSLPAVIQVQLEAAWGRTASQKIVAGTALALTGALALAQAGRVWRKTAPPLQNDELIPIRASTFILLFYLLFTCLWFQPWYALWPLALAALLPEGTLGRLAVLLSYAAFWKTTVFNDFIYLGGPLPPPLWRETLLGPATLGIVWLYLGYALVRSEILRRSGK